MPDLSITVDTRAAVAGLNDTQQRQVPFAMRLALTDTFIDFQKEQRQHMRAVFNIRREVWADRSIKITHFPKKAEPWITIGLIPPGGNGLRRADVLGKFEEDTEKRPIEGRTIAVPVGAMKRKTGIIRMRDRPSGLNLRKQGNRVIGDRGTFIVRQSDGTGLLLRRVKGSRGKIVRTYDDDDKVISRVRVGARASSVELWYRLVPSVKIRPTLNWVKNAGRVVDRVWERNFTRAFDKALRTAR